MISLDSSEWEKLHHAYGIASDIPILLTELKNYPDGTNWKAEPYFSLWSALCHQGDIYTASFAAVPHLLRSCKSNPSKAHWSIAQLIICIEVARLEGRAPKMTDDLNADYFASIAELPKVISEMRVANPNDEIKLISDAAIAVVEGDVEKAMKFLD